MILKTRKDLFEEYYTNIDSKQIYPTSCKSITLILIYREICKTSYTFEFSTSLGAFSKK